MSGQELLFAGLLFATVAVMAYALSGAVFVRDSIAQRLRNGPDVAPERLVRQHVDERFTDADMTTPVMERISHAAARPFMPRSAEKQSSLRKSLMHAGCYTSSAMELFVGVKVILLALGLVVGYVLGATLGGIFTYVFLYIGG